MELLYLLNCPLLVGINLDLEGSLILEENSKGFDLLFWPFIELDLFDICSNEFSIIFDFKSFFSYIFIY